MDIVTLYSRDLKLTASQWRPEDRDPIATVLLCHEAFGNRERWRFFGPALADSGYLAVAPDMAGHGESQGPRHHVSVQKWVGDLRHIMNELETGTFALVGMGSGGSAALLTATQDPRVKALALLSPRIRPWQMPLVTALFWQSLRVIGLLQRLATRKDLRISLAGLFGPLALVQDQGLDEELRNDPEFIEATNNIPVPGSWDAWFFNGLEYARRLEVPTLILHGRHDQMNSISNSQAFHQALTAPNQMVILEESGYLIPLDLERYIALQHIGAWLEQHLSNRHSSTRS
jgi:pimeloyl-ACP methyl ester carboxylesterase